MEVLQGRVVKKCWREKCCEEVLWRSVGKECCEGVLWRSVAVKCCRDMLEKCCGQVL